MVTGFFDGMQFSRSHNDAEMCESHMTAFLNNFYQLRNNFTLVEAEIKNPNHPHYKDDFYFWENQVFNITSIISGPFQLTFQSCTLFAQQVQNKYFIQKE